MCDICTPALGLESPRNVLDLLLLDYSFAQVYVPAPKCLWNVSADVYRLTALKARESPLIYHNSSCAIAPALNALTWFWLQQVFWSCFENIKRQYPLCALEVSLQPLLLLKKNPPKFSLEFFFYFGLQIPIFLWKIKNVISIQQILPDRSHRYLNTYTLYSCHVSVFFPVSQADWVLKVFHH